MQRERRRSEVAERPVDAPRVLVVRRSSTIRTRPSISAALRHAAAALVLASVNPSRTQTDPSCAFAASADRRRGCASSSAASACSCAAWGRTRLHRRPRSGCGSIHDGHGPCPSDATASCRRRAPRSASWSTRSRTEPRRAERSTTWCINGTLTSPPNSSSGRSRSPVVLPAASMTRALSVAISWPSSCCLCGAQRIAERTITSPPFGPGTAPLISRMFRSGSALMTFRFSVVTRDVTHVTRPSACP